MANAVLGRCIRRYGASLSTDVRRVADGSLAVLAAGLFAASTLLPWGWERLPVVTRVVELRIQQPSGVLLALACVAAAVAAIAIVTARWRVAFLATLLSA